MKRIFFVMLMLVSTIVYADELETIQPTALLVNSADSNDSALDTNDTSWGDTASWPEISQYANGMKVKFYAYDPCDPNNATFSYEFYVADYGCNAEKVAAGDATVGGAQLSHNPISMAELNSGDPNSLYCWVDTLGTITSDWKSSPLSTQNDGGLNDVASFIFDRECAKRAWCRIYSRSSPTMVVYCLAYYY